MEQNHDEKGIIWPLKTAPYHAIITVINSKKQEQRALAESIYQDLEKEGVELLLDNRDERPGVKFNDRDLIGIPLRITVGKKADQGVVEYSTRKEMVNEEISVQEAMHRVMEAVDAAKKE